MEKYLYIRWEGGDMSAVKDLTGQQFGMLTVLERDLRA